jgi:hypothetical protein
MINIFCYFRYGKPALIQIAARDTRIYGGATFVITKSIVSNLGRRKLKKLVPIPLHTLLKKDESKELDHGQ